MRSSPKQTTTTSANTTVKFEQEQKRGIAFSGSSNAPVPQEELESLLSFESLGCIGWERSSADSAACHGPQTVTTTDADELPLSILEKWLLDEATGQGDGLMEISDDFFQHFVFR